MSSKMNPNLSRNPNPNDPESFTSHFNENVDYTRDKSQAMGQGQSGQNVAQTQSDAQNQSSAAMDTATGSSDIGSQRATEAQTSIDSTNAGVDHSRSRYSFTAETLPHPED
ncbi:hypothetical protein BDW59DRAFT_163798 [Aspergillus cavernicola]|uniref:Uncharacterized protein n=1 Tax=Aspergillus cavernicola TaxID=176166 RepID=A0ABR4I687_9EURO